MDGDVRLFDVGEDHVVPEGAEGSCRLTLRVILDHDGTVDVAWCYDDMLDWKKKPARITMGATMVHELLQATEICNQHLARLRTMVSPF